MITFACLVEALNGKVSEYHPILLGIFGLSGWSSEDEHSSEYDCKNHHSAFDYRVLCVERGLWSGGADKLRQAATNPTIDVGIVNCRQEGGTGKTLSRPAQWTPLHSELHATLYDPSAAQSIQQNVSRDESGHSGFVQGRTVSG